MLTHLTLINFALAEHLAIDIDKGFNVLTGETGAGKSLLLDALSACLGERTDTNYVRYGTEKADVTASFSYQEHSPEAAWLKEHELDDESGEIHLRRVIFANLPWVVPLRPQRRQSDFLMQNQRSGTMQPNLERSTTCSSYCGMSWALLPTSRLHSSPQVPRTLTA